MLFHRNQVKLLLVQLGAFLAIWPNLSQCLIITSVIAGDKKFKTISFDSKFIKPLMFESELPTTEFRRHRTLRPPKFDIDVNIPIKLPLEDAYANQDDSYHKKPVVSDIALETGEIVDKPNRYYSGQSYRAPTKPYYPTSKIQFKESLEHAASQESPTRQLAPTPSSPMSNQQSKSSPATGPMHAQRRMEPPAAPTSQQPDLRRNSYAQPQQQQYGYPQQQPEFVPGGFVNLQLSGPTGGPKMTYEDFDREKWAQQLSQTAGAMPFPILNYHQLQNFYGGLGTFTNGLAENRYTYVGPLEKLKKIFSFMG